MTKVSPFLAQEHVNIDVKIDGRSKKENAAEIELPIQKLCPLFLWYRQESIYSLNLLFLFYVCVLGIYGEVAEQILRPFLLESGFWANF